MPDIFLVGLTQQRHIHLHVLRVSLEPPWMGNLLLELSALNGGL